MSSAYCTAEPLPSRSRRSFPVLLRLLPLIFAVLLSFPVRGLAATYYVKTTGNDGNTGLSWALAKKTIQAGINAAALDDEVWVAAGTYQERLTHKSGVKLYGGFPAAGGDWASRNWATNVTTIDATLGGAVITIPVEAVSTTGVDGFTIRNGRAANGGGIICDQAGLTLANCTIKNCAATSNYGGGLYCNTSSFTVTNTTFTLDAAPSYGGGIYCNNCATPSITGCTFTSNTASSGGGIVLYQSSATVSGCTFNTNTGSGSGGGVWSQYGTPSITGCTFSGNNGGGGGGGIYYQENSPTITGNTFTGNTASSGGGIYLYSASGTISGNTFTANVANTSGGMGGAIYSHYYGSPTIHTNVIAENRAYNGAGIYCIYGSLVMYSNVIRANVATNVGGGIVLDQVGGKCVNNTIADNFSSNGGGGIWCTNSPSVLIANNIVAFNASGLRVDGTAPSFKNNCVYGNDALPYMGIADQTGSNGNIAADPKLANLLGGNLHIQTDSPCIDAGDDTVIEVGWLDMDGQARIQGAHVDIGADESDGTTWTGPAPKVVYVATTGSDIFSGLSWAESKLTVQAGINAASAGDEVWVATGTYVGCITLKKRVAVYGGFDGTETLRSQRNWTVNITTLDANLTGTVVRVPIGAFAETVLDGFTVRNGQANADTSNRGGGLYCSAASVNVANCTFRNNLATDGGAVYLDYSPSVLTSNAFRFSTTSTSGGGVYCSNASPTISSSLFVSNTASSGGGIFLYNSSAAISGCTFNTNTGSGSGGGVYSLYGSPTITGCTFSGNNGGGGGGGIYYQENSPTITGNTFTGNTASSGGGIYLYSASGTISGNTFTANVANTSGGMGGAIYSYYFCSPTIHTNVIAENRAYNGGGIYCTAPWWGASGSPVMYSNLIRANVATNVGGGVVLDYVGGKCLNNTIADNFSSNGGGGIWCQNSPGVLVENNIVAFNASGLRVDGTAPSFKYNCVYGNDALPYMGIPDQTGANGNISADPKLANLLGGNLHIQPDSPCIDAGDDAVIEVGWLDMDGQMRTIGVKVDIGADESDATTWPGPPASKVIRVKTTGNDANDGSSWAAAKKTIQAAINTASASDEIWVAAGTYVQCVTLKRGVALYGGFSGSETLRSQRSWTTNITTINGNLLGTVVKVPIGCSLSTRLDGFNVRNGQAGAGTSNRGGGLYCSISSLTLANCTFRNNSATNGAGCWFDYSPVVLSGNEFRNNVATDGGGVYCNNAPLTISSSLFVSNTASSGGAGIRCDNCTAPSINGCTFNTNTASSGAGIFLSNSSGTVSGCTFNTNTGSSSGGGVWISGGTPSITGCTFSGNNGGGGGGGIYYQENSPTITGNTFTGNTASSGGGIYLCSASGTISGNTFTGNVASASGGVGGAIHSTYYCSPTIHTNVIAENRAFNGGGIYCAGQQCYYSCWATGSPVMYNNVIRGNVATNVGGGIALDYVGGKCLNNTIADNFSSNGGGGIWCTNSSGVLIENNIVAFNASGLRVDGTAPSFKYNCMYGNDALPYMGIDDQTGLNGNIAADPKLANLLGGNLHIQPGSSCKDAGDEAAVLSILRDMDGQDRILGLTVDIGADESNGTTWTGPAASKVIYVSTSGSDSNSGLSWAAPKRTVQAAIDTAIQNDEVWVAGGTYQEFITLKKRVGVFGGFAGGETLKTQRDLTHPSILDGCNGGTVVKVATGAFGSTGLDRFTVTRGVAGSPTSNCGGGLYCSAAAVNLADCIFKNNSATNGAACYFDYAQAGVTGAEFRSNSATSGSGIYCSNGSPTIESSLFASNSATSGGGVYLYSSSAMLYDCTFNANTASQWGGGVWTQNSSPYETPMIIWCTFSGNNGGGGGGGVYCQSNSPIITGSTFTGNTASHGGGVYLYSASGTISWNTFTSNVASAGDGRGGAVYSAYWSSPTIHTNVIADNRAYNGAGIYCYYGGSPVMYNNVARANVASNRGGGITFDNVSPVKFINNTVAYNRANNGGGGLYFLNVGSATVVNNIVASNQTGGVLVSDSSLTLKCNCAYDNSSYNYSGITDPTGSNGNISDNPLFANPSGGNLHIQPSSCCAEAGDDDAVMTIVMDMDGQDRIFGFRTDIGADETDGTIWPSGLNIAAVKSDYADGAVMMASALSVVGSFPERGYIYAEALDRSCGIRIQSFEDFAVGELVDVTGTVETDSGNGERYVLPDSGWPKATGGFVPLVPLALNVRDQGGESFGLQGGIAEAVGLNNFGLLVTTWGRVTEIDSSISPTWFKMEDVNPYETKVELPTDCPLPVTMGHLVCVTGVSACEMSGGQLSRVLRTRNVFDVVDWSP